MVNFKPKLSETQITRQIIEALNCLVDVVVFKFYAGGLKFDGTFRKQNNNGVSDILGCFRGKFLAIEVKVPGNEATDIQKQFLQNIIDSGGIAFVAHSLDEVFRALKIGGLV